MFFLRDLGLTFLILGSLVLTIIWFVAPEAFKQAGFLLLGLTCLFTAILLMGQFLAYPQTVVISDGKVEIKTPAGSRSVRLVDCDWDVNAVFVPFLIVYRYQPAIFLYEGRGMQQRSYVTCLDEETRAVWRAFLTLTALDDLNLQSVGTP